MHAAADTDMVVGLHSLSPSLHSDAELNGREKSIDLKEVNQKCHVVITDAQGVHYFVAINGWAMWTGDALIGATIRGDHFNNDGEHPLSFRCDRTVAVGKMFSVENVYSPDHYLLIEVAALRISSPDEYHR